MDSLANPLPAVSPPTEKPRAGRDLVSAAAGVDEEAFARTLAAYDYALDPQCIAQRPASPRDAAKLLLLPGRGFAQDHVFTDLPALLSPGDVLVVNETQVLPARLRVMRPSGAPAELLPFAPVGAGPLDATVWRALGRPGKSLRPGTVVRTRSGACLRMLHAQELSARALAEAAAPGEPQGALFVGADEPLMALMQREGELPLPPYVGRDAGPDAQDVGNYQTLFARAPGAVAAPTASLHFTERVRAALVARGVQVVPMVLHVGPGTFLPIRREHAEDVTGHQMHGEFYSLPEASLAAVLAARARGNKVVAAGTTSLRAMETWARSGLASGTSRLYVRPGFRFRVVDALLTNFHLPRTTLLMLVSAFCGRTRILEAYAQAQARGYRFFSYGDASLLHPVQPRSGAAPGEPSYVAQL